MSRSLGVYMIVKDESERLARAIKSVADLVDEIVVVDTGSTDDTVDIAKSLGARVEHFFWCDDFAAARNASLEAATTDVRVVLDADEWLAAGYEEFARLRDLPAGVAATVIQRSTVQTEAGATFTDVPLVRVLPRMAHYQGRIHEQPVGYGRVLRTGIVLDHDGYLPDANDRKRGRNERLLRMDIADGLDDAYTWYQLAKDLEVQHRYSEAADAYEEAMLREHEEAAATGVVASWRHELVTRALHCVGAAGRHDRAIQLFGEIEREFPESPDLYFIMAAYLMDWAARVPEFASETMPLIGTLLRRCLALGDRPDLDGSVRGRGSFLAARNLEVWQETMRALAAVDA